MNSVDFYVDSIMCLIVGFMKKKILIMKYLFNVEEKICLINMNW